MKNSKKEENKGLFSNIIGYRKEKKTIERIVDVLNNTEKYQKFGTRVPAGLLLYGDPGLGKTTFAKEIIRNLNRKSYIIRKAKPDGKFVDYLTKIFGEAKKNQPSVIFFDDMDKFSDSKANSSNKDEYVTVQSLIDDIKDHNLDIFILATANDIDVLPSSLTRSGRFDIKIRMYAPDEKDSYEILKYYLNSKKISNDVNIKNISYILPHISCADIEKIVNQAGIYACYNGREKIGMEELVKASLEFQYDTNLEEVETRDKYSLNVAYHEAGHALIGYLLEPKSVAFTTVAQNDGNTKGFTTYKNNDYYWDDIKYMENRVKVLLAGKASTEIVFNKCDTGSNRDLNSAFRIVDRFVNDYCMVNFNSWFIYPTETSEKVKQSKDNKKSELISNYYMEVKELLIKNRSKLDLLAHKLNKKKILFQNEIEEICDNG